MLLKKYNRRSIGMCWFTHGALAMCVCVIAFTPVWAQQYSQPLHLIESPTAGLLPARSLGLNLQFYGGDGILGNVLVGLFSRGMVGVSFGGQNLLGNGAMHWNPHIEFSARVRVIEEGYSIPGLALGYTSQGYGDYDETLKRYASKSKGLYLVASKNFKVLVGQLGIHLGASRSFEDGDGDDDFTGYIGFDMGLANRISAVAEYDLRLDDNDDNSPISGKGHLNAGIRWAVSNTFTLEFDLKNIFSSGAHNPHPDREIGIVYFARF